MIETCEEYALRHPDGTVEGVAWGLDRAGADRHVRWAQTHNPDHVPTVVHRTVTYSEWEPVDAPRKRGECPVCGRDFRITQGGVVWRHRVPINLRVVNCPGSGQRPAPSALSGNTREVTS